MRKKRGAVADSMSVQLAGSSCIRHEQADCSKQHKQAAGSNYISISISSIYNCWSLACCTPPSPDVDSCSLLQGRRNVQKMLQQLEP